MKALRFNLDLVIAGLVIAAFVAVAAQRLGTVPFPEGDEAFTLQVPYEMLNHGKLALPMLRYLGGNIENSWHSYIPVFFVILSGFHELFGLGLEQGRAFNLMTAAMTLWMIFLIGRRLFDWRVGMIAVVMLVGDQVFFERSRYLRDDFAAATFALLAFYLYERAEERKKTGLYVAAGLAAGAGVMSHTNMLYMIGAVCLLILMRDGWRALRSRKLYLFSLSALAVMAYEIVYDLIDYKNFLLQNRGDDVHFRVLESRGLWHNLLEERIRYLKWYTGGLMFPDLPQTTLRIFQLLSIAAIIYLLFRLAKGIRRRKVMDDPRAHLLVVTVVTVLFHALIVSQKRIFYLIHIVPWFALAVGVMLRDGTDRIAGLRAAQWPRARLTYRAALAAGVIVTLGYGFLLVWQATAYLSKVRNPELATFSEFTSVIRSIIPEELCPVAVHNPSIWLAFPEKDRCFANLEKRMTPDIDIDGNDYALVKRNKKGGQAPERSEEGYHLLGEMKNTRYGNIIVYYTGTDPRYFALEPKRYRFFGEVRGYVAETN